jgi:hypothetical protein
MAILKRCVNMTLKVNDTYTLQVDNKLEKKADKVNIEAKYNNLVLACNKKIVGRGGKE